MGSVIEDVNLLIRQFNTTSDPETLGHTLHGLIEYAASRHMNKTALICADSELTFKEVNERANCYGNSLIKQGIERGDIVGVALDRSIDLVPMLLAVLKAGAVYIPIDPSLPPQRICQLLADSHSKLVIADASSLDALASWQGACLTINQIRDMAVSGCNGCNLNVDVQPQDFAYIIYTSGSTGKPKGVKISHEAVCNTLLSTKREPGCHDTDRILAMSTICFDMAILELFLPLISGATAIIAQRSEVRDAEALKHLLRRYSVTMMYGTPAIWQILLDSGWRGEPRLKKMVSTGEALSNDLAKRLLTCGDGLWNLYGATEAAIYTTVWKVCRGEDVIIGSPILNNQIYILDENLSPVPLGGSGEVYIGGVGVGRGYHNNPTLTESCFLNSPFNKGLLYRTGDLGRFIAPGKMCILGRRDGQVKIRGYRIEVGDIEACISSHDDISGAAVISRDDRLIAYCVRRLDSNSHGPINAAAPALDGVLRPWIAERLPGYMIPAFFVELDSFPLTPNGKIDRKALPENENGETVEATAQTKSGNELERSILAIWSKVLGHDNISLDVNFFHIGGDSLRVVRVQKELERLLGRWISSAKIFEHNTIKTLAEYLGGINEPVQGAPVAGLTNTCQNGVRYSHGNEDIAIISMACRLPGGIATPEDYWELLVNGRDATTDVPKDRWDADAIYDADPNASGKSYCRRGGFITSPAINSFDASFFGISPREAQAMDPTQAVMLETCWEGFERAGYTTEQLRGSRTGVFIGSSTIGAHSSLRQNCDLEALDGYATTGTAGSVLSGRVSYVLGLEGPNLTVDTACSSSLVATHLACNALRQRECDMAISGGVSLLLGPGLYVEFSRLRGMSADGCCRAFAADTQGTGWAEGCAVVVLKRLSDAQRDGDIVHAILRGTAVNHDGQSASLTTPSGPAQKRLIHDALAVSGLQPPDIDYIEAHGTATKLGDPIEGTALAEVFKDSRIDTTEPLWIGSAKSNIGHTQAAAGLAGLLKVVLSMQNQTLPQSLHVNEPTPEIDWKGANMLPVQTKRPWLLHGGNRPRRAGVSAFGIGGTNAHAIVEEAPVRNISEHDPLTPLPHEMPFLLSGQSDGALREQADNLHRFLSDTTQGLQDVAFSLATTRNHFRQRLAIMARDKAELLEKISRVAHPLDDSSVSFSDSPTTAKPCLAMLFTGQGSQLLGISQALYDTFPVFREALDEIAAMFAPMLDKPLLDILLADKNSNEAAGLLKRTDFAQPCLFALEVSLWRLWQSWGVEPDFLLGHSAGELSIAHVAGILDLADACRLVAARGRLMQSLPSRGSMISLEVGAMDVTAAIVELCLDGKVDIACENTPQQTVASGDPEAINSMEAYFTQRNRKTNILGVSHAFHSFQMDEMLEEFRAVAEMIQFHPAKIPIVSSLTGEVSRQGELETSDYWVQQVRKTVLFSSAVETLTREGANIFLELGPQPVLCGMAAACLSDRGSSIKSMTWLPSLVPDKDAVETLHKSLSELHLLHVPVRWSGYFEPFSCRKIGLPTYAFQRQQIMPVKAPLVDDISVANGTNHKQAMRVRDIEQFLFQVDWHPAGSNTFKPGGSWGILIPHGELAWMQDVTEALSQSGMTLVPVNGIRDTKALAGLVCLWGSGDDVLQATREFTAEALSQLQDAVDMGFSLPILWITRHAIGINPEDQVDGLGAAALWGLMRTARSEHPELLLRLVDIDDQDITPETLSCALMLENEPECALRQGNVIVPRIHHVKPRITREKPFNKPLLRSDGAVLITGGMGGIGQHIVKWLAGAHGIRDIVLLSRRGMASPGAETIVSELSRLGAKVTVVAGDVGDANCVEKTLALFNDDRPLRGVFHAAGVLDDGLLSALTPLRCDAVFGPKVDGAWNLHRFTRGMDLDVFIMFSSISGVIGTIGQANYAAANTFLDALAHLRHAENLPATSMAWGSWSGDGMAAELKDMCLAYHAQLGLGALSPEQGLDLLDMAVRGKNPFTIAAKYDLERLWRYYEDADGIPPLFQLLLGQDSKQDRERRGYGLELRNSLKGASPDKQENIILRVVRTAVAKTLGFASPDHVDVDVPLQKLGIDSLATVLIRNQLTATLSPSANISFNHENLRALSQSLLPHVRGNRTSGHEAISGTVIDTTTNSHSNTREASGPKQLVIDNRSVHQTLPSELAVSDPTLVSSLNYFSSLRWCSSLINDYSPSSGLLPGYGQAITFTPRCFSPPSPEHDQFFRNTLYEQNNNGAIRHALSLFRPSDTYHLEDTSRPIVRVATLFALGRYTSGHKGIVHGGLIATLLDESLGIVSQVNTAFKKSGFHSTDIYVTGSLNIRFLAPLTTHEDVVCLTAWVENIQSRNIALKANMTNSSGKTFAVADSLWVAVDEGQSTA
ncbi:uncharacterized protein Triagg1_3930 [Trichoderma aggressivum f. europaeum]|uniref:Polyketide synthase n=1 Tax=Trichoderma aggressivum f. europaeum TaxID=173218 RepID=A0AAE1LZV2_9HYPO|nr:hypothetical protein Triagg1_3930 [Trichoderma aggressivum f. europaeum]